MSDDKEQFSEAKEHRDMLLNLRAILETKTGRGFFHYLFKHLEVGGLPPLGWKDEILHDKLGSLRAGQALFEITAEANPQVASLILAEVVKENHERTERERQRDADRRKSNSESGLYEQSE